MDKLNQLVHLSKCLQKAVVDFKAMEYPNSYTMYYNHQREGLIMLAEQCHDLATQLQVKQT